MKLFSFLLLLICAIAGISASAVLAKNVTKTVSKSPTESSSQSVRPGRQQGSLTKSFGDTVTDTKSMSQSPAQIIPPTTTTSTTSAPSPSPPSPAPSSCSQPVVFPNGSLVTFSIPSAFTGYFPTFTQTGPATGTFSWSFSLCSPNSTQAFDAPACAKNNFVTEGSNNDNNCGIANYTSSPSSIAPLSDGNGIKFHFDKIMVGSSYNSVDVMCYCSASATSLTSQTGSYNMNVNHSTSPILFQYTFDLYSQGCCAQMPVPTTTSLPGSNTCHPLTLSNGSTISFSNPATLVGYFPAIAQNSPASSYPWHLSLCDTQLQAQPDQCSYDKYMSKDSTCSVAIVQSPAISAYGKLGVTFSFPPAAQSNGYTWTNIVNCVCSKTANTLVSPTNMYNVVVSGQAVSATWNVASIGCCVDAPPTTTTTTTPAPPIYTAPPTTELTTGPISGNQCNPVTFPNGSYVPFTNYQKLTGYFPSIQQTGLNPHTTSWSLSLCDPSILSASGGGQICNPHSYLSENGCQTIFPELSFQTHSSKDQQVGFTYIRRVNATVVHYAYVYCACDSTAQNELKIPSNSYYVYRDPSGDMIEFWHVSSAECCAINPTGMSTTTTTSASPAATTTTATTTVSGVTGLPPPPPTPSTTLTTSTPTSPPSATTSTTTPSPGSNNNNNGSPGSSSSSTDTAKNFGVSAAGAAAGVLLIGALFFCVRWMCQRRDGNAGGGPSSDRYFRSSYEYQLNDQNARNDIDA